MSSTATCVQGSGSANPQAAANSCTGGFCGKTDTEKCHDKTQGECAIQKWVSCNSDAECASDDSCAIVQKPCFEPVISRTGSPSALGKYCTTDPAVGACTTDADCGTGTCVDDASEPVTAGLFCIPPTVSDSVNSAGGITGPGAIQFSTIIIACRCGDGEIGCDETCDDSNTTSGDGCSENCDTE
jgi:cysteine-rich repeat protein